METKRIKRYLKRSGRYTFKVDRYILPKLLMTTKGKVIDLEHNRIQNLLQGSAWSPNFKNFLDTRYKSIKYIREFPIIIKNRDLWESLCVKHNLEEDKLGSNYFLADYFIKDYNFIVEIDSQLHEEDYDKARDEYIEKEYGLVTRRFYEYGRTGYQTFLDNFQFLASFCRNSGVIPINFGYSSFIVENYKQINEEIIPIIERFEGLIANKKVDTIILSNKTLSISEYWTLFYRDGYLEEIADYFKLMYNINVVTKP